MFQCVSHSFDFEAVVAMGCSRANMAFLAYSTDSAHRVGGWIGAEFGGVSELKALPTLINEDPSTKEALLKSNKEAEASGGDGLK